MNVVEITIYRFRLKLKRPLKINTAVLNFREGFVIRMADDSRSCGWGEVCPLIEFSRENTTQAGNELADLPSLLTGRGIPLEIESLDGGFEDWLGGFNFSASVRFGVESAVLNLMAASRRQGLHRLLDEGAAAAIAVNGLLTGTREQVEERANALFKKGYRAFKLKVGRMPMDEDIDRIAGVRKIIGPDALLRLDANRAWSINETLKFMDLAVKFNVDYIEEPVEGFIPLQKMIHEYPLPIGVALDESLLEISPQEVPRLPSLRAVVIKPMLLGFEQAVRYSRAATRMGITPVISSAFESSLGVLTLASMAAATTGGRTPVGLDTLDWLEDDLLEPPLRVRSGNIFLSDDQCRMQTVKTELLEEFAR
ncbi:MAG: o-succinylbenzoate synthase [Desulfobacterales bacterium]|uniref:o-succinylbenzoate synthase n=1 Tax=Candidatus Desulfatibia profunda TaxID=2841695 RepID=A0A8J6NPP8_9BACT|nr:o-succinylbenzoate synthase [Candidatus Desulfatibia profunda]MBL7179456.1 o-succinylbenzoate synthase [Desulfobacterales bacterium]